MKKNHFEDVPTDVISYMFTFFEAKHLVTLTEVDKKFNKLITNTNLFSNKIDVAKKQAEAKAAEAKKDGCYESEGTKEVTNTSICYFGESYP